MTDTPLQHADAQSTDAASADASARPTDGGDASDDARVALEIDGVTKRYGEQTAVSGLSLDVYDGELLTILGPSGCGKTTTLRLLAGLERPTEGTVRIADTRVADADASRPPNERNVGLVFQDFALFPHLSVAENVAYGIADASDDAKTERVADLLELVDLAGFEERDPSELSGGQQQRVALARALAPEPEVLLLDEPFSSLDVRLRVEMREDLKRILSATGVTAVSVTHDQEEALSISDRVAVMHDGHLEQVGAPEAVFENPESRFVASFLGQAGFLSGHIDDETVDTPVGSVPRAQLTGPTDRYVGAMVDVLVRPDDVSLAPATSEAEADGVVVRRQYTGPSFVYHVELTNGDRVRCQQNHTESHAVGTPVVLSIDAEHALAWYPTR
ncbi:ABC transporter ATP-binding protein [Halarchaeum grantii]|uniref:Molybdate/tungstate import ATP-binding protein WtpC n=1 Tax=Halarchaeum grantii TaxID=1193105 RepID=A0A830F8E8_9EURY|nr:ABC transporter ATP-binding protein [Halarchaeum grantii]GGL21420.1 ABC transporter ATP-binding protein [Halarchaeum grantii]